MIEISEKLKNALYSNSLPRADIKISIKKTPRTFDGNEWVEEEQEVASFSGKDITNAKFLRSVDPTGAELPEMKLTWEQNYLGEVDEYMQPLEFAGVSERMAVDFSVSYDMVGHLSWESLFADSKTWSDIYEDGKTWQELFYSRETETISLPRTFLSSFPKIQGQSVVWESRDVLHFLTGKCYESTRFLFYDPHSNTGIPPIGSRGELVSLSLLSEKNRMINYQDVSIANCIEKSRFTLTEKINENKNETKENQLFAGSVKNVLKDSLSPISVFVWFNSKSGEIEYKNFSEVIYEKSTVPKRNIGLSNQKQFPEIEVGSNISDYTFDQCEFFVDREDSYVVTSSSLYYDSGEDYTVAEFLLSDPSTRYSADATVEDNVTTSYTVIESLNKIEYRIKGNWTTPVELRLYRIKPKKSTTTKNINASGVQFEERNEMNPFGLIGLRGYANERMTLLSNYYKSENAIVRSNTFGDASIEPLDFISVQTNLVNKNNGNKIAKNGIVISNELIYNGAMNQKIVIHELR